MKCEIEEMENVAESVLSDLSQDQSAFTASKLQHYNPHKAEFWLDGIEMFNPIARCDKKKC